MKTKKSTLLSLATAAAIVATTFGTYAVWDQFTATATSKTITIASPSVIVEAQGITLLENDVIGAESIEYAGTVTFNIKGSDKLTELTLTPTVAVTGKELTSSDYSVEITQASDTISGDATTGFKDVTLSDTNDYTVKVTIKNKELANSEMTVSVEGVAKPKTTE